MAAATLHPTEACSLGCPTRILVATDLTDLDNLLPHAVAQASAAGVGITLVHAVSPLYVASMSAAEIPTATPAQLVDNVRTVLAETVASVSAAGVACDTAVQIGSAADVICEEVRRHPASRLIMGTHGRGKLRQLALGSVAHEVIGLNTAPVFIVGPHAGDGRRNSEAHHILHPVSFTGNCDAAAVQAFSLARVNDSHLTLLHVLEDGLAASINLARVEQWAHNALARLAIQSGLAPEKVHLQVVLGDVAEQIVHVSAQAAVNWIALATDAKTSGSMLHESRAFRVMAAADRPVLLFRG